MILVVIASIATVAMGILFLMVGLGTVLIGNTDPLFAQIQKFVLTNNIDRAFKLCNAEKIPAAKAAKALLIRSNRVHQLELAYHEAMIEHLPVEKSPWIKRLWSILSALCVIGFIAAAAGTVESVPGYLTYILTALFVLIALTNVISGKAALDMSKARKNLLRLRNVLYSRANYVPPAYTPVAESSLTPAELADWREAMEAFENDITRRKENGEKLDVNDEYRKAAGPDGVLPPL